MMRLVLFTISEQPCAVSLDKVLQILTDPQIFELPLLRACFVGVFVYQGQVVPLLAGGDSEEWVDTSGLKPDFVLVCEAEFGLVGIPADRILCITKAGEIDQVIIPLREAQHETFEISDISYRLLDLNRVLADPGFTVCGQKDIRRLA